MKLVEITPENYQAAEAMSVKPEQSDFVATVIESLADVFVYKTPEFRLAVHDETVIGYAVIVLRERDGKPCVTIMRMMIDQNWQGKGFGRKLLSLTFDWIRERHPTVDCIRIASAPENTVATALYKSAGFVEAGLENGDIALYLSLPK